MPSLKNPKADLRSKYSRYIKVGLIVALTSTIIAFKFSPKSSEIVQNLKIKDPFTPVLPPINTTQVPNITPPPKAPQLIEAAIDVVPDDYLPPSIDDYTPAPLPDVPPKPKIVLPDEEFIPVPEELPAPVGGLKALQEKVHYTEIARRAGVEGTVYIQAKINKNGNVVEAAVLKGLGAGLDEEALNAVKITKFIAGKQRGRPVNVKMVIPIKFVLK